MHVYFYIVFISTFLVEMVHKIYTDPLSSPPVSPSVALVHLACHCQQKLMMMYVSKVYVSCVSNVFLWVSVIWKLSLFMRNSYITLILVENKSSNMQQASSLTFNIDITLKKIHLPLLNNRIFPFFEIIIKSVQVLTESFRQAHFLFFQIQSLQTTLGTLLVVEWGTNNIMIPHVHHQ